MHGLVNCAIECFVRDTYGDAMWQRVCAQATLPEQRFEPLLDYDDDLTQAILRAACRVLRRPEGEMLEDLGCALISGASDSAVATRRLLRFSGDSFVDFLYALDDLADRIALAVPDFRMPPLTVEERQPDLFIVRGARLWPGYMDVVRGVLRAMADEYGVLVLIDSMDAENAEALEVRLIDMSFTAGREFTLRAG
ncbi:heme NO-binding protein [Donghicola sp. C2-DW-16]|uniref:Heme NO-binding protein n=1 Tax=Donghicola mangrovi TaxID=2729614 RepID=A0A850QFA1_9RHOB|nr:heme NO-binding domain-containing protein [Donghicola mangrovi]NVO24799.1 heme NO-binding protein [Donghicola mangrovi]NVO29030.1 heme NO-binding protein [Donghicola mangrovi]